jgi:hypothetical protein
MGVNGRRHRAGLRANSICSMAENSNPAIAGTNTSRAARHLAAHALDCDRHRRR